MKSKIWKSKSNLWKKKKKKPVKSICYIRIIRSNKIGQQQQQSEQWPFSHIFFLTFKIIWMKKHLPSFMNSLNSTIYLSIPLCCWTTKNSMFWPVACSYTLHMSNYSFSHINGGKLVAVVVVVDKREHDNIDMMIIIHRKETILTIGFIFRFCYFHQNFPSNIYGRFSNRNVQNYWTKHLLLLKEKSPKFFWNEISKQYFFFDQIHSEILWPKLNSVFIHNKSIEIIRKSKNSTMMMVNTHMKTGEICVGKQPNLTISTTNFTMMMMIKCLILHHSWKKG